MFPLSMLAGTVVQVLILIALFAATQQVAARGGAFLWVRDLARPDWGVALIATGVTIAGTLVGVRTAAAGQRWTMAFASALVTVVALTYLPSGVGLFWGASSVIGILQAAIVARRSAA